MLGIDFSSGKPPSMLQMSKLFMNAEFRDASKQLLETLKEAGVDLTGKVRRNVVCLSVEIIYIIMFLGRYSRDARGYEKDEVGGWFG